MRVNLPLALLVPALTLLSSCGGGNNGSGGNSNTVTPQNVQLAGAWQAKAVSNKVTNAPTVFVEANLTQASGSLQSSALLVVNSCVNSNLTSSVSGTVNGQSISLTVTYAGVTVILNGSASTDGSTMSGSYTASGACGSDQGVWTAQKMGTAVGNYTGTISSNSNPSLQISVNAVLANSSFSLSGSAAISSVCFNNLTLTGFQIGGAASVTGTDSLGSNVLFVFVANDTAFNSLTGVYRVISGSCAGDSGTGTLTKVGSSIVSASPIDGLDRVIDGLLKN